ncbi:MAG: hypothetical protein NTW19_11860 [Planctomycetota bacterium]|nr:hypothetical protein [Planctomycetota bacterium]
MTVNRPCSALASDGVGVEHDEERPVARAPVLDQPRLARRRERGQQVELGVQEVAVEHLARRAVLDDLDYHRLVAALTHRLEQPRALAPAHQLAELEALDVRRPDRWVGLGHVGF